MAISSSSIRFRWSHIIAAVACVMACRTPAGLLAEPPVSKADAGASESTTQPAENTLRGIVVRKGSGKPLADVNVTIARVRDGHIVVGATGGLSLWPFGEKTEVTATTNNKGRFVVSGFVTEEEPYTLVATNPAVGAALIRKFRPADYRAKPLRVEIDDPAFVRVLKSSNIDNRSEVSANVMLTGSGVTAKPGNDRESAMLTSIVPGIIDKVGPLLPGMEYDVSKSISIPRTGQWATIHRHRFTPVAGQTLDLTDWTDLGTTLDGRLRATDGTPLADVNVMVKIGGSEYEVMGTLSDSLGRYEITGLPPGKHTLELVRYVKQVNKFDFNTRQDVMWTHEVAWEAGTMRITRDVNEIEVLKKVDRNRKRKARP